MSPLRLSVCMIVKNEAKRLPACLDSVAGVADEIVVVDTGSTDETCSIAEDRGCVVATFPWIDDFSAARNAALDRARGEWILVIDADERLCSGDGVALRKALAVERVLAYRVRLDNFFDGGRAATERLTRLFRRRPDVRFEGRIHEQVTVSLKRIMDGEPGWTVLALDGVVIEHDGYTEAVMAERGKKERNVRLLRQEVAAEPNDIYVRYKLSQELRGTTEGNTELLIAARMGMALSLDRLSEMALAGELLLNGAQSLLAENRPDEALAMVVRGAEVSPPHPLFSLVAGLALLALDRPDDALAASTSALLPPPTEGMVVDIDALGSAGRSLRLQALLRLGRPMEALREGSEWLRADPNDIGLLRHLAEAADALGEEGVAAQWRERLKGETT